MKLLTNETEFDAWLTASTDPAFSDFPTEYPCYVEWKWEDFGDDPTMVILYLSDVDEMHRTLLRHTKPEVE